MREDIITLIFMITIFFVVLLIVSMLQARLMGPLQYRRVLYCFKENLKSGVIVPIFICMIIWDKISSLWSNK